MYSSNHGCKLNTNPFWWKDIVVPEQEYFSCEESETEQELHSDKEPTFIPQKPKQHQKPPALIRLLQVKAQGGIQDSQSNESWFVGRKTLRCSLELPVRSLSVSFPSMNRGYFALRLNIKIYMFCTTFQLHCFREMLHVAFVYD